MGHSRMIDVAKLLIEKGADLFETFGGDRDGFEDYGGNPYMIYDYFKGDIDWWPEGSLKTRLKKMKRGKAMFGL